MDTNNHNNLSSLMATSRLVTLLLQHSLLKTKSLRSQHLRDMPVLLHNNTPPGLVSVFELQNGFSQADCRSHAFGELQFIRSREPSSSSTSPSSAPAFRIWRPAELRLSVLSVYGSA